MTLKNKHKKGLSDKNKRARSFFGLAKTDANNVISPWNFLENFALTSFEMQSCDRAIILFTAHIKGFLGRNMEIEDLF